MFVVGFFFLYSTKKSSNCYDYIYLFDQLCLWSAFSVSNKLKIISDMSQTNESGLISLYPDTTIRWILI